MRSANEITNSAVSDSRPCGSPCAADGISLIQTHLAHHLPAHSGMVGLVIHKRIANIVDKPQDKQMALVPSIQAERIPAQLQRDGSDLAAMAQAIIRDTDGAGVVMANSG